MQPTPSSHPEPLPVPANPPRAPTPSRAVDPVVEPAARQRRKEPRRQFISVDENWW